MNNDLISRSALKSYIDCGHLRPPTEVCFSELDVVRMLDRMPTIDAVEVVRCKDCRWFAWYVKELAKQIGFDGVCNKAGCEMRKRMDYCSYGEPWEDAEVE